MIKGLSHVCVVVKDYDEAIQWYQDKMGLQIHTDATFGEGTRWVTMHAADQKDLEIVLYKQSAKEKDSRLREVGNVASWVFDTSDCRADIENMKQKGVKITMEVNDAPWGTQAAFEDLYGNSFLLVQPREFTQEEVDNYNCNG